MSEEKKYTIQDIKKLVSETEEASKDIKSRIKTDIEFSSSV